MNQCWKTFCIDCRQDIRYMCDLADTFYLDPHSAESKLLNRQAVDHPGPATPPVAPLERLPPLIKRRICAFLAVVDMDGLLCTILAVPHLAADGWAAQERHWSWAGKRIITLGGYADSLPKNLLTANEEKSILDPSKRTGYVIDMEKPVDPDDAAVRKTYPRARQYPTLGLDYRGRAVLYNEVLRQFRAYTLWPDNAVLRNLTLKQHYRSDSRCHGEYCSNCEAGVLGSNFSLGQVVLIMTCWSDDTSTWFNVDWTEDDVHGEWAGHRLDIVALKRVPADWEDVTDAVKAKLMRLRNQPR